MKKYSFNYSPKTMPFPHQLEAIEYVREKTNVALFDEQGLGKTKIVIEALCSNMKCGIIDGALIVCKKHLIEMWKEEIETHSHLKYIVLRGSANEKGMRFMGYAQFYIINYESVIGEVTRLRMFLGVRRMAIVLDESHKIKSPTAKTTNAIMELRELAKKRIIVTGTPIANRPVDLWAQFFFLDGGELLGIRYQDFKKSYDIDLKDNHLSDATSRFQTLRSKITSHSIRRLKDGALELPEKRYIDRYVFLSGEQSRLYDQLRQSLFIEITNLNGEEVVDRSDEILKKLIRLAQIASNPFLIDKSYVETPAKFELLDTLIDDILHRNEKAIVWSCFVENIRILYKRYRQYGSLMLYGDLPIEKRNTVVRQFKSNGKFRLLIANPAAAKEGLTLTSANNAIYLDRNFNLVDYSQSQDRIHRISQTKVCTIYKIIARRTIDEYIDDTIYKKQSLSSYIQGDEHGIKLDKPFLSKEEILEVLGNKSR